MKRVASPSARGCPAKKRSGRQDPRVNNRSEREMSNEHGTARQRSEGTANAVGYSSLGAAHPHHFPYRLPNGSSVRSHARRQSAVIRGLGVVGVDTCSCRVLFPGVPSHSATGEIANHRDSRPTRLRSPYSAAMSLGITSPVAHARRSLLRCFPAPQATPPAPPPQCTAAPPAPRVACWSISSPFPPTPRARRRRGRRTCR